LELQSLDSIARGLVNGIGNCQAQGPHGGDPADARANGASEVTEGYFFIFPKHIACVIKAIQAKRSVIARPRERGENLSVEDKFLGTADHQARDVARAQRPLIEATHRPQTADKKSS